MKAIMGNLTVPRYITGKVLGKFIPSVLWNGLSCTYIEDVPEPKLPSEEWVVIKTRYGGICSSDMGAIYLDTSLYFEPFTSFPFTFGHENMGTISEVGANAGEWQEDQRVVVEPVLWCVPRGFKDLCRYCAKGEINRCERIMNGTVSPGLMTGYCSDTGGSWSQFFLAHRSQVYALPDQVDDENGLMVEPFAVGLHSVLLDFPKDDETIMIVGAGTIGLCTLAALRSLGCKSKILMLARYDFQARAAKRLGASRIIQTGRNNDYYTDIADITGAHIMQPSIGKRIAIGGVDRVYECVGSDDTLDDAIRLTRSGGRVILVGVPGVSKNVDWSAISAKELVLKAANTYNHVEKFGGKLWKVFDLALNLMKNGEVDLGWMVTHKYSLDDYKHALSMQSHRGITKSIRSVFAFNDEK
jgi:threonine dehydrogenase-like Zn-dependent dehydrogenase